MIVNGYLRLARSVVVMLEQARGNPKKVSALNARLPPATADIQIEAFRGYRATLGETVVLPGITLDVANFWPTRPRRPDDQRDLCEELMAIDGNLVARSDSEADRAKRSKARSAVP